MAPEEIIELTDEIPSGTGELPAEAAVEGTGEESATPETVETPKEAPVKGDGVQRRFDELTRDKYEAQRDRDYWRNLALDRQREMPVQPPTPPTLPQKPNYDDYDSHEAYIDAITKWNVAVARDEWQRDEQKKVQEAQMAERVRSLYQWVRQGQSKYADFEASITRSDLSFNELMGEFFMDSPYGHEIAYKLAQNGPEAMRISKMGTVQAIRELQKIEASIKSPQKSSTEAPTHSSPVGGAERTAKNVEDPDLSYDEFKKIREKQIYGG